MVDLVKTTELVRKIALKTSEARPDLTHCFIDHGRIMASDGISTVGFPFVEGLKCAPAMDPFYRVVKQCKNHPTSFSIVDGGLQITGGRLRAVVPVFSGAWPPLRPVWGNTHRIPTDALRAALVAVAPFMGLDEHRPHLMGVLLEGSSVFATNNVCAVERFVPGSQGMPRLAIPAQWVRTLITKEENPTAIRISNSFSEVVAEYADGSFISSRTLESDGWPEISRMLDGLPKETLQENIPDLYDCVKAVMSLNDNRTVYIDGGSVHSRQATMQLEDEMPEGCFRMEMLLLLNGMERVGFSNWPNPVPFRGEMLRGAIAGMRA